MTQTETNFFLEAFLAAGATRVEADILQPADTLLDLYGEDIRARAYVTHDPLRGELMLRPDFTVPVVQRHMNDSAEPARYTYAGPVFRAQEEDTGRPSEFMQVGYEVFDLGNPALVEAEVFAVFHLLLAPLKVKATVGDIGLITAAVAGLTTSDDRKAALMRHIWRPARFQNLLDRFSQPAKPPVTSLGGPQIGLRNGADVKARLQDMADDAQTPPIPAGEIEALSTLLSVKGPIEDALGELGFLSNDFPAIEAGVERLSDRMSAIETAGVSLDNITFSAAYGQSAMEYYDGFVFGFYADGVEPAVASGGRYDALTRVLGQGRDVPAVGGVIRPNLTKGLRQ